MNKVRWRRSEFGTQRLTLVHGVSMVVGQSHERNAKFFWSGFGTRSEPVFESAEAAKADCEKVVRERLEQALSAISSLNT